MNASTEPDVLTGAFGAAHRIPGPDSHPAGLEGWLITAPGWHPAWTQYDVALISLAGFPGLPPATLQRPHVTHELLVMAVNPEHGPYDAHDLPADGLRFLLRAPNIFEQFTATDEAARQLTLLCARAVVDGILCPDTGNAPDPVRAAWRSSIHQTLAHDSHHGRLN